MMIIITGNITNASFLLLLAFLSLSISLSLPLSPFARYANSLSTIGCTRHFHVAWRALHGGVRNHKWVGWHPFRQPFLKAVSSGYAIYWDYERDAKQTIQTVPILRRHTLAKCTVQKILCGKNKQFITMTVNRKLLPSKIRQTQATLRLLASIRYCCRYTKQLSIWRVRCHSQTFNKQAHHTVYVYLRFSMGASLPFLTSFWKKLYVSVSVSVSVWVHVYISVWRWIESTCFLFLCSYKYIFKV